MTIILNDPFTLPCGVVLPNRLAKAAMTEGLSDKKLQATDRLANLYRTWSEGGAGLLITGNVMIDQRVLERAGNVAIDITAGGDSLESRAKLQRWAQAGTVAGNQLWMQISHAGRQSPRYITQEPLAPSAVQLDIAGSFAKPRALCEEEILDFINRFAQVAKIARETGFTGVQIHSAHGYLLSSFLSPITNQRNDAWGGSLENRARFLLETMKAVRKEVGNDFPVAIKLNSDDFRKGGFNNEECLRVVEWLNHANVDLLEISGGTYEQPRLLGSEGKSDSIVPVRASTKVREAYFLEYASAIHKVATMPLMVTGGFRTAEGMEAALNSGDCAVIGLARPLCTHPNVPKLLLARTMKVTPQYEKDLVIGTRTILSPASSIELIKIMNVQGAQGWYYEQMYRLADNQEPEFELSVPKAYYRYWKNELISAWKLHQARK
ncbi:MAG: NADH:flavin oxidoreductase/NADH oxidase family protein [Agitococcus sp.]|nr:NADH:flavin oxidoreductase/NADH oxidase family protein [Agitococcus sp.]